MTDRHPGVVAVARHFECGDLDEDLRIVAERRLDLAHWMVDNLPDDPQLTLGLHDLLRARDCFIRTAVVAREG